MDFLNGLFEFVGGYFVWMNFFALLRARKLSGVYWPTTLFFTVWGLWNLIYYPALNQWISFFGGLSIASGNIAWLVLLFALKRKERLVTAS